MSLNSTNVSKENQGYYKWCNVKAKQEKGNSQFSSVTGRLKQDCKVG